jgi:hypothetical protein
MFVLFTYRRAGISMLLCPGMWSGMMLVDELLILPLLLGLRVPVW